MKKNLKHAGMSLAIVPMGVLSAAISSIVAAQEESTTSAPAPIEEIIVLGRLQSSAEDIIMERMEEAVAVDIIDAETIGRIGDSTVASALQRLPGVTLVDDKYVYVRGLGERYLTSTLNGAMVPSPDLTRNVLPLDIFPTTIVKTLNVQKVYSADMFGTFGGGSVDIKTKGIPEFATFFAELSTGMNSNSDEFLTYSGGGDDQWGEDDGTRALSPVIADALDTYLGDLSTDGITSNPNIDTQDEANQIRRQLASELYRDLNIEKQGKTQDMGIKLGGGTSHIFNNDMEVGVLAGISYGDKWRNKTKTVRNVSLPDERVTFEEISTYSVDVTANLSLGFKYDEENIIETTSLFIRNTDDETSIANIFNENRPLSGGSGFRDYNFEYEQREMTINQVHGDHVLNSDLLDTLKLGKLSFLEDAEFNWYYSDSEVTTDKPNEVVIQAETVSDENTGKVISSSIRPIPTVANYRFTELEDYVDSYGYELSIPLELGSLYMDLSGGWEYWKKARVYKQLEFALGMDEVDNNDVDLSAGISDVFSDQNVLNENFDFGILSRNTNSNSYIAANRLNSMFGEVDLNWNDTVRWVTGVRWEDYKQATLNWNPLEYKEGQIQYPEDVGYRTENDYFVSTALTYMATGFWADDFQLRLGLAKTKVRPDIREISPSTFNDPLTDLLVYGNPDVKSSKVDHLDLRAEWFFSSGNNLTVSMFHKVVTNPIELFGLPISDGGLAAEVANAEEGTITGLEFEGFYGLEELSDALVPFFLQGNLTLLDSELTVGDEANAPTNLKREMNGASPYSVNFILGFDSEDSKHSATLSYNVFGERLFFAGRNGASDIYENPFNSLNLTYSFYPTEEFTVKFKAKNLLDEDTSYKREDGSGVERDIIEISRGQEFSLSVQYAF